MAFLGIGLQEGFLGSEKLIHLQKKAVFHKDQSGFQQALPHQGEEFRRGKSQPLGWGGQVWLLQPQARGASGCPAAVPLVVSSDALTAAFFLLKDGCGGVGQSPCHLMSGSQRTGVCGRRRGSYPVPKRSDSSILLPPSAGGCRPWSWPGARQTPARAQCPACLFERCCSGSRRTWKL